MQSLFKSNNLFTKAADLYNQILPCQEQKALQAAMKTDFGYGQYDQYLPYAHRVIEAYTQKGADAIRSHPTASNQANLKLLDMVEAYRTGQAALEAEDDQEFMTQFDKILAMAPVNEASFNNDMAMTIAGDLAGIRDPSGPPTVIQTKALEKLQRHAFKNAETMKPKGGHSYGSGTRMKVAILAGKQVEQGYDRHNLPKAQMHVSALKQAH